MAKRKTPSPAKPDPMLKAEIDSDGPSPRAKEYTVLARRYRPQQFQDLVGQEPVAQSLINALQSNRVAHAYLFTGARGVGKTSCARILARALNCEKGPTVTPCGNCDNCRAIAEGEDVDVLEIDGASNRRIEEIREIRGNVQYRPTRSRYKIYIIDEVHMLTKEAFNALLKTLEEPPPHVKFIFATTEVQKIPITILSRCQRFDFMGIGIQQILDRLREIVAGEKMQAVDEALEMIARRAGGSMRDAQSLLDQLLAFGGEGEPLTAEQVHRLLGTANEERLTELAGAILERDAPKVLALLAQTADQGAQLGELLDQLMDFWRDLMVVQCTGLEQQALSVSPAKRDHVKKQAQGLSLDTILAGLDILANARSRLRFTSHARVLVEMALVRLCRLEDLVSLSQLAQWLDQGGEKPRTSKDVVPSSPRAVLPPGGSETEKKKPNTPLEVTYSDEFLALSEENISLVWPQILEKMGFMVSSLIKKANVAIFRPNNLVFAFPTHYNWQSDPFWSPERLARMEETIRKITGQTWNLRLKNLEGEAEAPGGTTRSDAPESPGTRSRKQRSEIAQMPLVGRAMDLLGAQILNVDEGFGTESAAQPVRIETPEQELIETPEED